MRYVSLLLVSCLLCSCATITRGPDEVITVDSNPSGASATIACAGNISATGMTPARLTLPRIAEKCRLQIVKPGMHTESVDLERGFNSHYWMNFTFAAGVPIGGVLLYAGNHTQENAGRTIAVGSILVGITGLIVDRATGSMYDHNPNVVKVTLQPEH